MTSLPLSSDPSLSAAPLRLFPNSLEAHGAFVPFMLLGWPNPQACLEIIKTMLDAGVDMLELGLAFSDPIADGPVIEAAANHVLAQGITVAQSLALLQQAHKYRPEVPISLMVYSNMVLAAGMDAFCQQAATAGVSALLMVDCPAEQFSSFAETTQRYGLAPIFIVSPLTSAARLKTILQYAQGYLYVVSRLGITGVSEQYDDALTTTLQTLKQQSDLPRLVGFGISEPHHAQQMRALGADGVITGSRILQQVVTDAGAASPQDTEVLKTYRPTDAHQQALITYLQAMRQAVQ